jgi:hypothetical protein
MMSAVGARNGHAEVSWQSPLLDEQRTTCAHIAFPILPERTSVHKERGAWFQAPLSENDDRSDCQSSYSMEMSLPV